MPTTSDEILAEALAELNAGNQAKQPALSSEDILVEAQRQMGGSSVNAPPVGLTQFQPQIRSEADYLAANQIPGIPLKTTEGADFSTRATLSLLRTRQQQLDYLNKIHPEGAVRLSDEGEWIIRSADPEGNPTDVVVDERNPSFKDLADMFGGILNLIGSIAAMRAGRGRVPTSIGGGGKVLEPALLGSAGWSATGGAIDLLTGAKPVETGNYRAGEFASGTLIGVGLGGVVEKGALALNESAKAAASTVGKTAKGPLVRAGKAIENIKGKTGIELMLTSGEAGMPLFQQFQSTLSRFPLTRRLFENAALTKRQAEDAFQSFLVGGDSAPAENLASRLWQEARSQTDLVANEIQGAEQALRATGQQEMTSIFKGATPGADPFKTGSKVIEAAKKDYKTWREGVDDLYAGVRELPEAQDDIFPLKKVADVMSDIRENFPSVPKKLGDKIGQFDDAVMLEDLPPGWEAEQLTDEGRELLGAFQDNEVLRRVNDLASRGQDKTRWFDLVQMRTMVQDMIDSRSGVLGDIGRHNLRRLRSAITGAIEEGTEAAGGEFKKRLKAANAEFSKVERYDNPLITRMLREPGSVGEIMPEQVVERYLQGGKGSESMRNKLVEFFGAGSQTIEQLDRHFLSEVLEKSSDSATGLISPGKLLDSLQRVEPGMARELFGVQASVSKESAKVLLAAEGKLPVEEVNKLIQGGSLTADKLIKLQQTQAIKSKLEANGLMKLAASNEFENINPAQVVAALQSPKAMSPAQTRELISQIGLGDPALLSEVRRGYLRTLFSDASKTTLDVAEVSKGMSGKASWSIDPSSWTAYFKDPDKVQHMRTVLGDDTVDLLRDYGHYLAPQAERKVSAGLAPSESVLALLRWQESLGSLAKYAVTSYLLTRPKFATMIRSGRWNEVDATKWINRAILSPEFGRVMVNDHLDTVVPGKQLRRFNELMDVSTQIKGAIDKNADDVQQFNPTTRQLTP